MIRVLNGNLFDSEAQTLVNAVNCVGVMGKGIALEFKRRFPEMFEKYAARCARGEVVLGQPYLHKRVGPPWILNFPTKEHWRSAASLPGIIGGLDYLHGHYKEWEITSIAVPALGCGLGHLQWSVVGPLLRGRLSGFEIPVDLYAPQGEPCERASPSKGKGHHR